jgi:hypothetical protein
MQERRRFRQIDPLDKRLSEETERLGKEARGTPPGIDRDSLIRRARVAETVRRAHGRMAQLARSESAHMKNNFQMTLDEKIAQAQRYVESGRHVIENQRLIVARIGGRPSTDLLESFERTQQIFEMDLADLLTMK